MNGLPSVSLWFKEGASDKVYNAAVEEVTGGFVVKFEYGRRGATLTVGTKTQTPVTQDEAIKVYNKLILSKTAKGYKPTGSGDGLSSAAANIVTNQDQRDTGLRPQLLNPISEDEAEKYILDNDWCAQEKFNGKRMIIKKDAVNITAANKKGLSIGFPDAIRSQLSNVSPCVVDGECVGETLHVFDILESPHGDCRAARYEDRLTTLQTTIAIPTSWLAKTAIGTTAKRALMAELKKANKEGIVFKRLSAQWYAGRPASASGSSAIKCKFWASCSCVVSKINAKRSIEVSLDNKPMGNVTIPPNKNIPEVGQVVEVKYLYVVGQEGSLYQPIYLEVRDDVSPDECTAKHQNLKYKPENED